MEARIAQVAVRAGVSIATVSRAFAHPDMVSPKTRKRVYQAAEELNYSISRSATAMKTGRSFRIALLISEDISSWFDSLLFSGLVSVFGEAGYDISVYQVSTPEERKNFFTNLPIRRNADAVIVSSFSIEADETHRLRSIHIPIIGVNPPSPDTYDASVRIDDFSGMKQIVEYVLGRGSTNITYVCPVNRSKLSHSAEARLQGFQAACADHDPAIEPRAIMYDENAADPTMEIISAMQSIGSSVRPTALCCHADLIAMPLAFALRRRGLRIPEDIAVTGFDDAALAADYGLTTMRQQPRELGKAAARKALALINGEELSQPHELAELQLQIRETA